MGTIVDPILEFGNIVGRNFVGTVVVLMVTAWEEHSHKFMRP